MLLPPSSLERLPISPFQVLQMRKENYSSFVDQSTPLAVPLPTGLNNNPHEARNDIEPPFVGSFPSPTMGIDQFNNPTFNRSYYPVDITDTRANQEDEEDDLPFAVDSCGPSSFSEHSSKMFSQRYTIPQKLQSFDNAARIHSSSLAGSNSQGFNDPKRNSSDENFEEQLADFHNFGDTLSHLIDPMDPSPTSVCPQKAN